MSELAVRETAVQPRRSSANALMDPATWQMLMSQAAVLAKSGLLPDSVRTPEAALAIMMKGHELGMPPMQSFAHIHVIKGKPCLSAESMLALIFRDVPGAVVDFVRLEDDYCEIHAGRPGRPVRSFVFQKSDAVKAGLSSNPMWGKYPRAMHRSRCVSEMARTIFPDVIAGCYTPEELTDAVYVNDAGEVVPCTPPPDPIKIAKPSVENFDKNSAAMVKRLTSSLNKIEPNIDKGVVDVAIELMHGQAMTVNTLQAAITQAKTQVITYEHTEDALAHE